MRALTILLLLILTSTARAETTYFQGHGFEAYIISNHSPYSRMNASWDGGRHVLHVSEGQEYSIVVRNPLPVRAAVSLSVDGLNTIDGKNTSPASGSKWLIQPYSSITIRGWQTGDNNLRKFVFTRPENSYAAWRERTDWRTYQHNIGLIRVAYFWNSNELNRALHPPHGHVYQDRFGGSGTYRKESQSRSKSVLPHRYDDRAGTGMGRREHHHVRHVSFNYNTGMYSDSQALKIHYKFGHRTWQPHPNPRWVPRYNHQNYTPEMP